MRTLSVAAIRRERRRNGEKGFTLIELLVVVTIIGILAAIVSVSVGGFTGQATIKSRRTTLITAQSAVDIYNTDNVKGDGTVAPPTVANGRTTVVAADATSYFGSDGKTLAAAGADVVYMTVVNASLTSVKTTIIGGSTTTRGPYMRTGATTLVCVFINTADATTAANDAAVAISTEYKIYACKDN